MMRKIVCFILDEIILAFIMTACTMNQAAPIPQPTNSLAPTPQPKNTLTPTLTPTRTPTPISFSTDVYKGWLTYTNAKYKFSVRYPSNWTSREIQGTINTMSGHAVYIEPRATTLVRLVVGFKRASDDQQITRTGIGSGEIVGRGSVAFLGQSIDRNVLVLNGKDLAILYQCSSEIRRGDLVFTLSFDYRGNPTDKSALTQEMENIADKIVASFEVIR